MGIGALNEGGLHRALKDLYSGPEARQEVAVGAYVADVMAADSVIYEIQTAGFGRLRAKLSRLLASHRVVLVHPVAAVTWIHKLVEEVDRFPAVRRSPRKGRVADILNELVSIPDLLDHPNLEIEVVLVEQDEFRRPAQRRRGPGWQVVDRRLRAVVERVRLGCAEDLLKFLNGELPEPFSTSDLAVAMSASRAHGQKLAYCLLACGVVELAGKKGNARLYRYRHSRCS